MRVIHIILLLLVTFAWIADASSQIPKPSSSAVSFNVTFNKDRYLLNEPVFAEFHADLKSGDPKPYFATETSAVVFFEGEIRDIGNIGAGSESPQRLPVSPINPLVQSGEPETIVYDHTLELERAKEIFSAAGNYQIQFFLHVSGEKIPSNVVNILVETPTGIDKTAFGFLKKFKGDTSFEWVWTEKDGLRILENFAQKYRESVYADYALEFLGSVFLAKNELGNARNQFEKLKTSNNRILASHAERSLEEIQRKMSTSNFPEDK